MKIINMFLLVFMLFFSALSYLGEGEKSSHELREEYINSQLSEHVDDFHNYVKKQQNLFASFLDIYLESSEQIQDLMFQKMLDLIYIAKQRDYHALSNAFLAQIYAKKNKNFDEADRLVEKLRQYYSNRIIVNTPDTKSPSIQLLSDIIPYVNKDTVVLFDIDDTLIANEWANKALTEEDLLNTLQIIDKKGAKKFGFTIRSYDENKPLNVELKDKEIHFSQLEDEILKEYENPLQGQPKLKSQFKEGIFYSSWGVGNKGEIAPMVVDKVLKTYPETKSIIFVDDASYHVDNVCEELQKNHPTIDSFCFHYLPKYDDSLTQDEINKLKSERKAMMLPQ
jgi:hypothetical protein